MGVIVVPVCAGGSREGDGTIVVRRLWVSFGRSILGLTFIMGIWLGVRPPCVQGSEQGERDLVLRAWGVARPWSPGINAKSARHIVQEFEQRHKRVKVVSTAGLQLEDKSRSSQIIPLMRIAGDIPDHVSYMTFGQTGNYISNRLLYPLDRYIEKAVGFTKPLPHGHLMKPEQYAEALSEGRYYDREIKERVPRQCWEVIRRRCPHGSDCPYLERWKVPPGAGGLYQQTHFHTWCFPQGPIFLVLAYRKDMFAEAGLPDRPPATWDEYLRFARAITDPSRKHHGVVFYPHLIAASTVNFLYSAGGRLVERDENGQWKCVFDSDAAVEAYFFVARLFLEPFKNEHGRFDSVVYLGDADDEKDMYLGLEFFWFDTRFFGEKDASIYNFGPSPMSPTGQRGSEFNSRLTGIYAGLAQDNDLRDAAWEYIRFYDGPEARRILTEVFVAEGMGRYVQPRLLRQGGYEEYVRQVPAAWQEAFEIAWQTGVPDPYGENCQEVFKHASKAIEQIRRDEIVTRTIQEGSDLKLADRICQGEITRSQAAQMKIQYVQEAKGRIKEILRERVARANEKMFNQLDPRTRSHRSRVATGAVVAIFVIFALLFRRLLGVFEDQPVLPLGQKSGRWQFFRYKWAYFLVLPAVGSIAIWAYYPLARGTLMAFQDYNIRGFSKWVGIGNFASVLYDEEFWFALWVTVKYTVMFIAFGFVAPIVLAFLLTEVPRGKLFFRIVYYMPAILTGVVVIFLWKGFYREHGMVNQVLNCVIAVLNCLPGIQLEETHIRWLDSPHWALFFCLLPTIWAGIGPGCLIYLAALKTIPEELYEAADIDGAGVGQKISAITLPSIKTLIMINFVGAVIGCMKSGGELILAMTGGGPYTPHGETELLGLHIYWEAFGYLRLGSAVAMAWVLGSLLVGFTVFQIRRLSKVEFRTAEVIK